MAEERIFLWFELGELGYNHNCLLITTNRALGTG